MKILFQEEQKFTQWWLWLILFFLILFPLFGLYQFQTTGVVFGDSSLNLTKLLVTLFASILTLIGFLLLKLKLEIDEQEIRLRFIPFVSKTIRWEEVASANVVNYGFIGGWGVRKSKKYGSVYNTTGNMGLAIILNNGEKFCVGTQREEELKKVIEQLRK